MLIDLSRIKSGFSDKLRAITFFIALSKFKKINYFQIYEKKNYQCPFKFVDFCKVKKIKIYKIKKNIIDKNKIIFTSYNSEINQKNCHSANKYSSSVNNKELLIEWKNSYKKIYPNNFLQKKIDKINLPKNFISVHIRSTDRVLNVKNMIRDIQLKDMILDFQLRKFSEVVVNFLRKYSKCKNIYISSDQEKLKYEVIKQLQKENYNTFFNKCEFKNTNYRKTNGKDFLIDLFCLSKSKIVFSTVGGGVSYTAHLLSGGKSLVVNWLDEFNRYYALRVIVLSIYYLKKFKKRLLSF